MSMFNFWKIIPGQEPELLAGITPVSDGKEAAKIAKAFSNSLGFKVQQRPIKDDVKVDWQARERKRMTDGTYKPMPKGWDYVVDRFPEHFLHISKDDETRVAYTPDEEHGIRDRQITTTPGRYLTNFFKDFYGEEQRKALIALMEPPLPFFLATTREDIADVYEKGPRSCMAERRGAYKSAPIHPTETYASGDLAIAYLKDGDRITARCLVWPEKKVYGRIYGDEYRLGEALRKAGYKCDSEYHDYTGFDGAKVLKLDAGANDKEHKELTRYDYAWARDYEHKGGLVVPYFDNSYFAKIDGDYLIMMSGNKSTTGAETVYGSTSGVTGTLYKCKITGKWASLNQFRRVICDADKGDYTWFFGEDKDLGFETVYCSYTGNTLRKDIAGVAKDRYGETVYYSKAHAGSNYTRVCESDGQEYIASQVSWTPLRDKKFMRTVEFRKRGGHIDNAGYGWFPTPEDVKAEQEKREKRILYQRAYYQKRKAAAASNNPITIDTGAGPINSNPVLIDPSQAAELFNHLRPEAN